MPSKLTNLTMLLLLVLLAAGSSYGGTNDKAGTSAYSFLKIWVGARTQAMGGSGVGLADDETALHYNPGGLPQLLGELPLEEYEFEYEYEKGEGIPEKRENWNLFTVSYNNYLSDIQSGFLAYLRPFGSDGIWGVSLNYFNYGSFDETDIDGNKIGTFGASDLAIAGSYAHRLSRRVFLGGTVKFIYESIQDYSSTGLAFDAGFIFRFEDGRTQVGGAITNLGTQLSALGEEKESLPTLAAVGFSHRLRGLPFTLCVDANKPLDNDFYFSLGGEFTRLQPFFLRLGWNYNGRNYKTDSDKDNFAGLSGGFGYNWKKLILDYSYSSFADLGGAHRITFSGSF